MGLSQTTPNVKKILVLTRQTAKRCNGIHYYKDKATICVYTGTGSYTISTCNSLIINSHLDGDKRCFSFDDLVQLEIRFLKYVPSAISVSVKRISMIFLAYFWGDVGGNIYAQSVSLRSIPLYSTWPQITVNTYISIENMQQCTTYWWNRALQ